MSTERIHELERRVRLLELRLSALSDQEQEYERDLAISEDRIRDLHEKGYRRQLMRDFRRIWRRLAELGACDAMGGGEYLRVKAQFRREVCTPYPADAIERFIRIEANRGPG